MSEPIVYSKSEQPQGGRPGPREQLLVAVTGLLSQQSQAHVHLSSLGRYAADTGSPEAVTAAIAEVSSDFADLLYHLAVLEGELLPERGKGD